MISFIIKRVKNVRILYIYHKKSLLTCESDKKSLLEVVYMKYKHYLRILITLHL